MTAKKNSRQIKLQHLLASMAKTKCSGCIVCTFFLMYLYCFCSVFSYTQACSPKLILPHISKCLLLHLETILLQS